MLFFQQLLSKGGFATWLILIAAFCLFLVSSERFFVLFFQLRGFFKSHQAKVREFLLGGRQEEALQVCQKKKSSMILQMISRAIVAADSSVEAMRAAVQSSLVEISEKSESRLGYIAMLANVATLLGLLGTITGLIKTFQSLVGKEAAQKAELLGSGISEAMLSTASGLIVGVIAMVIHSVCSARADKINFRSQKAAYDVMSWIEQGEA